MRKRKIWQLQKCDREYAAGIAADLGVSPVVVSVLLNRGVREKEEIIAMVIESEDNVEKAKAMVAELTAKYPLC